MKPTANIIYAKQASSELKKSDLQFETVEKPQDTFEVLSVGKDVTICKPGNTILFTESRTFTVDGHEIHTVLESDVRGVK